MIDDIIKQRIPEKIANKYWSRFRSEQDKKDYVQDMYLELLSVPKEKLQSLKDQGDDNLYNYFARICLNQLLVNSNTYFENRYNTLDYVQITKEIEERLQ